MVVPNKMRITTANIKLQRDAEKNMAMDAFPSSWIEIVKRLSISPATKRNMDMIRS
jgi:hypothetical protein